MTGFRVLVADDDEAVRNSLDRLLRYEGYQVDLATNGAEALVQAMTGRPDMLILDVLMPNVDGLQACRALRESGSRLPVLMLTARDAIGEKVDGLDAGADDYVVKPFDLEELLARIRALLRRSSPAAEDDVLRYADLRLDRSTREVHRGNHLIELTRTEFNLLELLMTSAERILTRQELFERIWGYDPGASNTLDVYVGYLRRKLERHGQPRLVHTVRGVGYILRWNADEAP